MLTRRDLVHAIFQFIYAIVLSLLIAGPVLAIGSAE